MMVAPQIAVSQAMVGVTVSEAAPAKGCKSAQSVLTRRGKVVRNRRLELHNQSMFVTMTDN